MNLRPSLVRSTFAFAKVGRITWLLRTRCRGQMKGSREHRRGRNFGRVPRRPSENFGHRKALVDQGFDLAKIVKRGSPPSAANIANRKRYRFGKPRNHNGFWFFCAVFQGGIQKISFPKNDLWGGLELNTWGFRGRFCDLFRRICPFFRFSNC